MASILKVDDLRGNTSAGDITITDGGGNVTYKLQESIVHTYVKLNMSTAALGDNHNVTSLTDNGTGDFNANLTNSFSSVDVPVCVGVSAYHGNYAITTSVLGLATQNSSHAASDSARVCGMVGGDLA